MIDAAELERAAAAISASPTLALACHMAPDGDALGSMLALHLLAQARGKASVASWSSPAVVATHYAFLPGLDRVTPPEDFPPAPKLMVAFDCGSAGRLGTLAAPARAAETLIVIDHHVTNGGFGHIDLVDPKAAATAVVVRRLLRTLGWDLTPDAALCLYTGLVCDTGRFQYDNTTPEVFALAQELAGFDLPIAAATRQLFEQHRLAYLRMAGEVLARATLFPERRFVAAVVTAADMARHGVDVDEAEGLIDLVRRTAEADVSAVLKEAGDGVRVSLRAVTDIDVGAIASGFGGGGHRAAAGFTSRKPAEQVLEELRLAIPVVGAAGP
ncbi:MAG: DHH family phosphoesterase [Acidimicrobiales bacterium]